MKKVITASSIIPVEYIGDAVLNRSFLARVNEIVLRIQKILAKMLTEPEMGFLKDELSDYSSVVVVFDDNDSTVTIEVHSELSYSALLEIADKLNDIVSFYDEDSYFDMVDPGIVAATLRYDELK